MTAATAEMGPIDHLVMEFAGDRMTGESLSLLVDLVDREIIRILDLAGGRIRVDALLGALDAAEAVV